ncbi:MAG: sigma-70 family RNA polymerase sigma factor [Synergistaceae bacterium]|nr:sigma-70 family RNA polymerase sigma factor [Synergistaceae bacterium]MBR1658243.1 sigma-70 family RNA polymerase sigma factor [Synergistaceae bacterium]
MSIDAEHERELWRLCSEGDMDARNELIVSYRPLVFWIAGKIHVNDSELKEDMIQEGMLALIHAVDKFEPEREYKFSTYAYHKIHGQIINLLERSEKKAPVPVPDEYLTADYDYHEDYDGDEWLDASNAVSKLKGKEAEIVSALFFEGKKPKDIAEEKKLDLSHVYRLRRTAIAKMRMWLGIEGAIS